MNGDVATTPEARAWTRDQKLQGGLYTMLGSLPIVAAVLASNSELTARSISAMIVNALIGGGLALKAFLSSSKPKPPAEPTPPPPAAAQPSWQQ